MEFYFLLWFVSRTTSRKITDTKNHCALIHREKRDGRIRKNRKEVDYSAFAYNTLPGRKIEGKEVYQIRWCNGEQYQSKLFEPQEVSLVTMKTSLSVIAIVTMCQPITCDVFAGSTKPAFFIKIYHHYLQRGNPIILILSMKR